MLRILVVQARVELPQLQQSMRANLDQPVDQFGLQLNPRVHLVEEEDDPDVVVFIEDEILLTITKL